VSFLENVLLLYSVFLTVILTIGIAGLSIIYSQSKDKEYLFLALLFGLMLLDNTVINLSEFSSSFEQLYESSTTVYVLIYSIYYLVVIASRYIIRERYDKPFTKVEKLSCMVVPLIVFFIGIYGEHKVFELVASSSYFIALIYLLYLVWRILGQRASDNSLEMRRSKVCIIIFVLFALLSIGDSIWYFNTYDMSFTQDMSIDAFEYRNIPYDVMKLFAGILGIWYLIGYFKELLAVENKGAKTDEEKLEVFSNQYELTSRQKEIVALIVEGDSNKEISRKLHITEGTVKTHIYNIFKKVDVTSRNQIIKKILS